MTRHYFSLTDLAAAASARDCSVHLHRDDKGRNVFSVGNSDMGETEFLSYHLHEVTVKPGVSE